MESKMISTKYYSGSPKKAVESKTQRTLSINNRKELTIAYTGVSIPFLTMKRINN